MVKEATQDCPHVHFSLTLPVEFNGGLSQPALSVLKLAESISLRIKIVNLMTMDYYTPLPNVRGASWGAENVRIVTTVYNQLRSLYSWKSAQQVWAMIGICPMIGFNDDQTIFTLNDWEHVLKFAKKHKIGLLTFWAINRDQVAPPSEASALTKNVYSYSNAQTQDYAYVMKYKQVFGL
ncbi:unnamed protein product [Ambrosiozyma monospora]|uniref:Unnamed protein product n=2 Tax=Ambrosiozyma monospora TaxID=43982 RepID=A0ACB5U9V9_AMBMO|nr:unnamed protein product [Ambrosiozyma monospora]